MSEVKKLRRRDEIQKVISGELIKFMKLQLNGMRN